MSTLGNETLEKKVINFKEEEADEAAIEGTFSEILDHGANTKLRFQFNITLDREVYSKLAWRMQKTISDETNTTIAAAKFASKEEKTANLAIKGKSREGVIAARNRIESFARSEAQPKVQSFKKAFTHFLSISLRTEAIISKFEEFKEQITENFEMYGLEEPFFQKPERLHLTLVMLSLDEDDKTEQAATECLKLFKETTIDRIMNGRPLVGKLSGVGIMKSKPTHASVLYAKVTSDELQEIANEIAQHFAKHGFGVLEYPSVTLHATVINSKFSQTRRDGNSKRKRFMKRITFDATNVLENFKDFEFGSTTISEIQVSMLSATDETGYYKSAGSVFL